MRRRLLLLAALVLLAAGCQVDVTVTTTVQPDGSGAVTVRVQPDAELLERVPTLFDELRLDDVAAAGWTVTGPDQDRVLTLRKPFATPEQATLILAELNGPQGPLRDMSVQQERTFARTASSFAGTVELEGGLAAFADAALVELAGGVPFANQVTVPIEEGLRLTVAVQLPGRPGETTSENVSEGEDAVAFTWQPSLAPGAVTPLDAHAVLRDRGAERARWMSRAAWIGLASYGLLIGIGVLWWLSRRRPSSSDPAASSSPPGEPDSRAPRP